MSRLVLSRKKSEKVRVGHTIEITVVRVSGDRVQLGVSAPPELLVLRHELAQPGDTEPPPSPPDRV
jgi:carbon storage regulator